MTRSSASPPRWRDARTNIDVDLPAPEPGSIVRFGDLDVATAQVNTTLVGAGVTYVQVARDHDELDATISRLWFSLR